MEVACVSAPSPDERIYVSLGVGYHVPEYTKVQGSVDSTAQPVVRDLGRLALPCVLLRRLCSADGSLLSIFQAQTPLLSFSALFCVLYALVCTGVYQVLPSLWTVLTHKRPLVSSGKGCFP